MTSWMVSMGSSTGDVPEGEIMMTLGVLIFLLLFLGGFLLCKIDFRDKPRWRSRARILQLRRGRAVLPASQAACSPACWAAVS